MLTKIKPIYILVTILLIGLFFRSYKINSYPALNPDEAAIGYNAYSLILTGQDEHGISWPLHFKSFGDFKPGGYFYLVLPFVKLLGLNELSVRLPNLILSLVSIYVFYLLIKLLSKNESLSLLSAFVLAINPWHIHFSRGGWESNTALSFIVIGTYFFFKFIHSSKLKYFYFFVVLFVASLYTYHSARIVAPLIALSLFLIYKSHLLRHKFKLIIPLLFGLLIAIPVAYSFLTSGGATRFSGVGLTADQGPIWRANELLNHHANVKLVNRVIHNQRFLYLLSWAQKYFSHFDINYLFINGDEVPRSKVPEMGQFYLLEIPLLLWGAYSFLRSQIFDSKSKVFIFLWLIIAPLASSLTFQAPSALRSLPLLVPLIVFISYGLYDLFTRFNKSYLFVFFGLFYLFSVSYYFDTYFNHYEKRYPFAWNYGFRELISEINTKYSQYQSIYVTDSYDQPYILFLFFNQFPPQKIQPQIQLTPPDKFGFSTVAAFDKYHFQAINWDSIPKNSLVIAGKETVPASPVSAITNTNGSDAFKIYIK